VESDRGGVPQTSPNINSIAAKAKLAYTTWNGENKVEVKL
jgi:hypothetical protein